VNPTSRGRGFICAWKLRSRGTQYPVTKTKTAGISRKSITSFTINASGDILAYASTDLSIGLIDAQQLKVSKTAFFLKLHFMQAKKKKKKY
jgi:prolactin regulatory element-binding protein